MRIDKSLLCVVAVCEECAWRDIRATPAAAWTALAIHAKKVHGDRHAVNNARAAARAARARENRHASRSQ